MLTETSLENAARKLRVLGHPARLKILEYLERGEAPVTAIQNHVGITQAMTSQHLKSLHGAGLLSRRRDRTSIIYSLQRDMGTGVLDCIRRCEIYWVA